MSNETKQTAVESIKTTFFHYAEPYPYFSEEEKWVITKEELFEILEQAKEMEKEQIIDGWRDGFINGRKSAINEDFSNAIQYHNETYGDNK